MYSRDEGNMPDDHENDMFDKVTRQICNRIDEMEDTVRQQGKGGDSGNFGGGHGGGGGPGGPGGGSDGGLMPMFQRQSIQIQDVKKDMEELKKLMLRFMKMPVPEQKLQKSAPDFPDYQSSVNRPQKQQQQPMYPPANRPQQSLYPSLQRPQEPERKYSYPPPPTATQRGPGYTTDPEYDLSGGGRGRGKRRRRGKRGGGSGYDSDNNSVFSEQLPMQYMPRPRSPGSVKSAPGGNKKKKKGAKPLTGSWEDIRAELNI